MVSRLISRLIYSNGISKSKKFIRIMEEFRVPRFSWNARKASEFCIYRDPPRYITRIAMPVDYDNVISFLCCHYFRDEPSVVNIGLSGVPPTAAMLHLALTQVKKGMTIIAVNDNDLIIGAAVNVRACPWDSTKMAQYAICCEEEGPSRDLIEFFAYVSCRPNIWRLGARQVFECCILAVDSEYRRVGVAKKLVQESWCLARDCGYRCFRINCTSRYAARIARGFGWKKICTIPYCRYVENDEMVFKNIQEPHTVVDVYIGSMDYYGGYVLPYKSQEGDD